MRETYRISPREALAAVAAIASATCAPLQHSHHSCLPHASRRDAMAVDLVGTKTTAASIFLEHGVAVLPGAVKRETAAACRAAAAAALACSDAAITNNIRDLDASAPGAHHQAVRRTAEISPSI